MTDVDKNELGYVPALALFDKPSVDTGVKSHKWIQYRPVANISSGVLEFRIPGTSNSYINLKCSTLQIQGKIVKAGGVDITDAGEFVGFVNAPLQSLWSQVDLSLQQKVLTSEVGTNYAYKAYMDLLLNNAVSQSYQLSSQLYILDGAGMMDNVENPQSGVKLRSLRTEKSQMIQLEAPLLLDLAQQDRYMLNGVDIGLKFWPNKAPFYLLSSNGENNYKFEIKDVVLNACTAEISPAILVGHAEALKIAPAVYPYFQSDVKSYEISQGVFQKSVDNIFNGEVPSEVIIGLVSAQAYSGAYDKNPFNFQHFDCNFVGFYVDGNSMPRQELTPKFKSNNGNKRSLPGTQGGRKKKRRDIPNSPTSEVDPISGLVPDKEEEEEEEVCDDDVDGDNSEAFTEAYLTLFGHEYDSIANIPITMERFAKGFCLYRFKLSQNIDSDGFISLSRRGVCRLALKFSKCIPEEAVVVVYAKFPRVLQINQARNVIL